MYNLHPFFASFPIVILVLLSLFVFLRSRISFAVQVYGILIGLLVIFSLLSFYSGFYALDQLNETQITYSLFHQQIGRLLMIFSFGLLGIYLVYLTSKNIKFLYAVEVLIIVMCIFAIFVGYHGASLVFDYGLGVKLSR